MDARLSGDARHRPRRRPIGVSSGTLRNVLVDHQLGPAAARLAAAGVPVRLLHGGRDAIAPLDAARELANRHGWPVRVRPGAGHDLPVRHPGACAAFLGSP
jgi:pimeloyl-ACP methyl ester carboxylesterase